MNLTTKQKHTYRHREQTCGCQGGGSEGVAVKQIQSFSFARQKKFYGYMVTMVAQQCEYT